MRNAIEGTNEQFIHWKLLCKNSFDVEISISRKLYKVDVELAG